VEQFVHPPKTTSRSKEQMAAVLWELHLHGPVKDSSGQAAAKLLKRLEDVGYSMSINGVNRIVNVLDKSDRLAKESSYPYHYINRVVNGRRTMLIELIVDPREVPFPPNPFKEQPRFESKAAKEEEKPTMNAPPPTDAPETFARQGLFESFAKPQRVQPKAQEPEPDPEPEREPAPEPVAELAPIETEVVHEPEGDAFVLEPYEFETTVRTNGSTERQVDDDLFTLPEDLLSGLDDPDNRRSTELIAKAIGLLSDAMAAVQTEQIDLVTVGIGQEIDRRFGEYQALQDRLRQREDQLRHVVGQYERVVELARTLRKRNAALEKRLAQSVSA
jgi:hypothetical protein